MRFKHTTFNKVVGIKKGEWHKNRKMKTAKKKKKKQIKRSSLLSDSRVVNHRGFERTRGVCRGLWVSKLGRHPPPGRPLIYHGRRSQLSTTNKRQAVWATCHRAFNCLFLSLLHPTPPKLTQPLSHLLSLPVVPRTCPPFFLCLSCLAIFVPLSFSFSTFLISI